MSSRHDGGGGTNAWISGIADRLGRGERHAWRALLVTLHALRDLLPDAEAAQLAAQLPSFMRDVYWANGKPRQLPRDESCDRSAFLHGVMKGLMIQSLPPERAVHAVLDELTLRVSPREIDQVRAALPLPVRELWIAPIDRRPPEA